MNPDTTNKGMINVSEIFWDTIQGEGVHTGEEAIFFRVQGCWMNCVFCDTRAIWRQGRSWYIDEIVQYFSENGLIEKLKRGVHLVITGGSPMMQQKPLIQLIHALTKTCGKVKPFIEVETELSIMPKKELFELVDTWNCSPKLSTSLVNREIRYNVKVLKKFGKLNNAWFNFVFSREKAWEEIEKEFLPYIPIEKVMLMPEGDTVQKLDKHLPIVQQFAREKGVAICDRVHIREGKR